MKSSIVLIGNPVSKRASASKIVTIAETLKEKGFSVETFITMKRGDAETYAKKIALKFGNIGESPLNPLILAAGGDGTINEVINGLVFSGLPMGIIPLGTTNVLAKEIGIPEDVEGAIGAVLKGREHLISVGMIVVNNASVARYFCLMVGIGFDGEAVFRVSERVKRISGKGAFILSGIQALINYRPEKLSLIAAGKTYSAYSSIICNASKYGGDFAIAQRASLEKKALDACFFIGGKRMDLLRYAWGIVRGRLPKDVLCIETDRIEILGNARVQVDGDYLGFSPGSVSVVPEAIKLIY